MADYTPKPEHKFTFGLWTTANVGRDPFGEPTRAPLSPIVNIRTLAEHGAWGYNFHDNDLVPFGASAAERDRLVREAKRAMDDTGIVCSMATTNLFSHPVFKDGAFTSNDARVRAFALQKAMHAIDLGVELGAKFYVFWGGREGTEVEASKSAVEALKRFREALNFLCRYVQDQGYDLKFALEAKPNEPRGDLFLPTTGAMLGFIATLDQPDMVGLNPEYAHETMAGLNFAHAVAQAIEAGKLFHIDLNGQKMGRFDQDMRFGAEDLKGTFFLVKLLEDSGYNGPRHFDAHAYRSESPEGVWDFVDGCMRTYLILKAKAAQFNADPAIQALLQEINLEDAGLAQLSHTYSSANAQALKSMSLNADDLASRRLPYERLDQLTNEVLLGVR